MTRVEFIKEFASTSGISQAKAREYADNIASIIVAHMSDDNGVKPFEGMVFEKSYTNPRIGRNPQTGEPMEIAGHFTPKVRFGKAVKEAIQE